MNNQKPDALKAQVAGNHYSKMAIQPMQFSMANGWDACAHTILKYISRHADKNGVEDLKKARHCVDLRVELSGGRAQLRLDRSRPIRMSEYLNANQIGIFEAAALKALDSWVWEGGDRYRLQLLTAIDTLIKRYDPGPMFGSLDRWPGDRLDGEDVSSRL